MKPFTRITLLIPTYRRAASLARTLESVDRAAPSVSPLEIVVVDNAADEETRRVVLGRTWPFPVKLLTCVPRGKSAALNAGLDGIADGLVVFLDDDIVLEADWFTELHAGMARWPDAVGFGARVACDFAECPRHELGPMTLDHVRGYAFGSNEYAETEALYADAHPLGGCMGVLRDCMPTSNAFDPETGPAGRGYRMGNEAMFFEWLREHGHRIVFLPRVRTLHSLRAEQVALAWLKQRSFSFGRSLAFFGKTYRGIDGRRGTAAQLGAWGRYCAQSCYFGMSQKPDPRAVATINRRITEGILYERLFVRQTYALCRPERTELAKDAHRPKDETRPERESCLK